MPRIGEEGETAGQEPADDLGDRVGDGQGKDERERARAPRAVAVAVVAHLRTGGLIETPPLKSL